MVRRFLIWLPFRLPEWLLRMHRDEAFQRTWVLWFDERVSAGWKYGKYFDRLWVYLGFGRWFYMGRKFDEEVRSKWTIRLER